MTSSRIVVLCILLVGFAACGSSGSGKTSGSDAGRDSASVNHVTGTFDESGSPCVTGNIKGFSNDPSLDDPACTVVEHPGDGGSPVTFGSCVDNNQQAPCWGWNSCDSGLGFTFLLDSRHGSATRRHVHLSVYGLPARLQLLRPAGQATPARNGVGLQRSGAAPGRRPRRLLAAAGSDQRVEGIIQYRMGHAASAARPQIRVEAPNPLKEPLP